MPTRHALLLAAVVSLLPAAVSPPAAAADVPAIAAAAHLKDALDAIALAFRRDTGHVVRLAFGSSGNFTQQIENGAPFELFLAADEAYVRRLADRGLTRDAGTLYAIGRLVLFVPNGSPLAADATLHDLGAAVADGRLKRFAIANPEHAPYGRAARAALQHAGVWQAIEPRLVLGENAAQAMQFAATAAQGGIVPWSLAITPAVAKLGRAVLLPESAHPPLRQRMALLKRAGKVAVAFHDYLQQPQAREILAQHGFSPPAPAR